MIYLKLTLDDGSEATKRVQEATKKRKVAKYEPTMDEVWRTGYTSHTGTFKKGILSTVQNGTPDMGKLLSVKEAIENGEIGTGVETLTKFSKAHALRLWKQVQDVRRESIIKDMVTNKPANYHLITTTEQFVELISLLAYENIIAVDTETTGVDMFGNDYIVGISLTLPKADYHCYIPVRHNVEDEQLSATFVFESLKGFLEDESINKVLHNAKFDVHMLRKEGIIVKGLHMDTMVAMHVLNENEPSYALKNLATKYGKFFGFEDKSMTYEELFGKCGFENTPLDIGTVYACKDTHLTYKFYTWIMEQFNRVPQLGKVYFGIELPITEICVAMEERGFLIDLEFAKEYCKELEQEIATLESRIKEGFGNINLNSNKQLQEVIYGTWGVPSKDYDGKVDKQALKMIVDDWGTKIPEVSNIKALLDYRKLVKLYGTYIEPLPQKISPIDGHLHGQFQQASTVTGRFASNNPNLQNIPPQARKMIVAPEGKLIIGIDYSQIEPRFLAHISGDSAFKQAYIDGRDLYSEIASKTFKKSIEECGDGSVWRKKAKVVLLG